MCCVVKTGSCFGIFFWKNVVGFWFTVSLVGTGLNDWCSQLESLTKQSGTGTSWSDYKAIQKQRVILWGARLHGNFLCSFLYDLARNLMRVTFELTALYPGAKSKSQSVWYDDKQTGSPLTSKTNISGSSTFVWSNNDDDNDNNKIFIKHSRNASTILNTSHALEKTILTGILWDQDRKV